MLSSSPSTRAHLFCLLLAALRGGGGVEAAACNSTSGTIATLAPGAACNYANFLDALSPDCKASVAYLFLDDSTRLPLNETMRIAQVQALCDYDAPTQFVEIQGTYQDDRRYFAGGSDLVDGQSSWNVLSGKIKRFEANLGSKTIIAFPEYAARLEYNANNGLGTNNGYPANMNLETSCNLNTIMCCFTDAGVSNTFQANGDPTTDVCRHDLRDSPQSNHIANGWSVFPGSETPTHCVGFTWKDDADPLLGNMMYDVSLRQTAQKGYRRGVPGAPMCGCVEHMPVVESAKCRTATLKDPVVYSFQYNAQSGYVTASNTASISYQDCPNNADLATQYKANQAGNATASKLIDQRLVGTGNCSADLEQYLNNEQFLLVGQHPRRYATIDNAFWSDLVVGEGIRFLPPHPDPIVADTAFRALINAGCVESDGVTPRFCIVRRYCDSCTRDSHIDIYYKRKSTLPPMGTNTTNGEVYFLDMFMNQWTSYMNILNKDFELYSSYQDALNGVNKWMFCNYDSFGVGFPRDCGPRDSSASEWNSYSYNSWFERANHHGFYVEKPRKFKV